MKNRSLLPVVALLSLTAIFSSSQAATDPLDDLAAKLTQEIERGQAYSDLKELVAIGPRLAASTGAEKAVAWAQAKMLSYGFANVRLQPVTVPHWERGSVERADLNTGDSLIHLKVTALGGSVGTPAQGVSGEVVEVHTLDEVDQLGAKLRGKIVFYNRAMDTAEEAFDAYDDAVDQRYDGASRAAKYGAVAVVIRSLSTLPDDDHPHTGIMSYRSDAPRIPAGALSTHAANILASYTKHGSFPLRLTLSAQNLGTSPSYNVIGELPGSELPNEYVVIGGHLDAWDLGTGAQDDGTGVVSSLEALRAMKSLGIRPKRTIRVVLFMAEEFGGYGAREYARQAAAAHERYVAAIESDRGAFAPIGFERDPASSGGASVLGKIAAWAQYLSPLHADSAKDGFSGTDVEPLNGMSPTFGYVPESKHYFDFHHSALDQIEAVDPIALNEGASAMAIFAYLASEKGL